MRPQPIGCGNGNVDLRLNSKHSRFNEAAADRLRKQPSRYPIQFSRILSTLCERSRCRAIECLAASRGSSASTSIHEIYPPRAVPAFCSSPHRSQDSSCNENRVHSNLALHHPRQQTGLNLEQPPVTHTVVEQRMRHQGIHPQFVSAEESLSSRRRQ